MNIKSKFVTTGDNHSETASIPVQEIQKRLRAVIYARVSTQEQAQGKASIPDQLGVSHKVIAEKGWECVGEYTDLGISGHLLEERHGLQSLLRDAREHRFDLIVVKDYDRFARNKDSAAIVRKELKELGIQTFAVNTPVEPQAASDYDPDNDDLGTIVETFSDMRADLERKQISRRMKMGRLAIARAGEIPNRVPFGYRVVRELEGAKVKRTVVVDKEAAEIVKFIYAEYVHGTGDRKIAIAMNERGWRTLRGGWWSIKAVRYILANPTYTGKVWWGWRHANYKRTKEWRRRGKMGYIGQGAHEAIIEERLFAQAQEIRAGRRRGARGGAEVSRGLLTGIAKCIRCGSGVGYQKRHHSRSKNNPKWKDTDTFEYICTGYKYRGKCSPRVMSAAKLEGAVLDQIRNIYAHPKIQDRIVHAGDGEEEVDREKEIERLEREIAMQPEKMERDHDAYERGILTLDEYEERINRIREQTSKSRMEQERLMSLCHLTAQKAEAIKKLTASLRNFDAAWTEMKMDERRMILRSVIRQIRAGDGKVEIDFTL